MSRFAVEALAEDERAFVESIAAIHRSIEALKIVFPGGRYRTALEAMQFANAALVAAALRTASQNAIR